MTFEVTMTPTSDKQPERHSEADEQLEREIRDGRKFTLAEAIGRMAGPDAMKGTSPATRKQQAEAVIESFLDRHLQSPAGALSAVLFRRIKESDQLLNNLDQPLAVLTEYIEQLLGSEYRLQELVREADVEWGRVYGERPYFQQADRPPHTDDPYTRESVHRILTALRQTIPTDHTGE
jgi:hypothetical protein